MTPQESLLMVKGILDATLKAGLFQSTEDISRALEAYNTLNLIINPLIKEK